jgi:hypothetical protein
MRTNTWEGFEDLLPERRHQLGTVTARNADGTSSFELPGGSFIRIRGQLTTTPPYRAFAVDGALEGPAPNLPVFDVSV